MPAQYAALVLISLHVNAATWGFNALSALIRNISWIDALNVRVTPVVAVESFHASDAMSSFVLIAMLLSATIAERKYAKHAHRAWMASSADATFAIPTIALTTARLLEGDHASQGGRVDDSTRQGLTLTFEHGCYRKCSSIQVKLVAAKFSSRQESSLANCSKKISAAIYGKDIPLLESQCRYSQETGW